MQNYIYVFVQLHISMIFFTMYEKIKIYEYAELVYFYIYNRELNILEK